MMVKIIKTGDGHSEEIRTILDESHKSGKLIDEPEFCQFVSEFSVGHGRIFDVCPVSFVNQLKEAVECVERYSGYKVELLEDPDIVQIRADLEAAQAEIRALKAEKGSTK